MMKQRFIHFTARFFDDKNNVCFIRLLLLGLFLRLLLMPFFGHIDVLSEARRVYFWSENNIFFDTISRNTTMFIETVFFKLTAFLLPDKEAMFFVKDITHTTAAPYQSFEFVSHSTIFRTLFVLKLPFLIFDLLTAGVLYWYHGRSHSGLDSCKIWLFNPVTLFAFYIFGRFESIPIFFIAAAILAFKHKRYILAAILVGLCVNGREMMILYAPVCMIAIFAEPLARITLTKKIAAISLILVSIIIVMQIYAPFLNNLHNAAGMEVGSIVQDNRIKHLFAFQIHSISILPLMYSIVCIWVWNSTIDIDKKIILGCGLAIMSFFAFSSHTAHFTSWMVIFPAFFAGYNKAITRPFITFCLAWFVYWCFLTDLGVFTHWLASAYSLHVVGIPNIPHYFQNIFGDSGSVDLKMIIYLSRTFFVSTLFYMGYQMIRYFNAIDIHE